MAEEQGDPFKDMEPINGTRVAPAVGIGALALNFALKYHNINTVQDGQLYQQYKLEGRNMRELHLDNVFETAILMELHLLGTSERIANLLIDAISVKVEDEGNQDPPDDAEPAK